MDVFVTTMKSMCGECIKFYTYDLLEGVTIIATGVMATLFSVKKGDGIRDK